MSYATYKADGMNVYLCNRTRTLGLARVDLSYIVGVRKGSSGANVYGGSTVNELTVSQQYGNTSGFG